MAHHFLNLSSAEMGQAAREVHERVKAWVRSCAGVPEDVPVILTERECTDPDCPVRETLVTIWHDDHAETFSFRRPKAALTKMHVMQAWEAHCRRAGSISTACQA